MYTASTQLLVADGSGPYTLTGLLQCECLCTEEVCSVSVEHLNRCYLIVSSLRCHSTVFLAIAVECEGHIVFSHSWDHQFSSSIVWIILIWECGRIELVNCVVLDDTICNGALEQQHILVCLCPCSTSSISQIISSRAFN